GIALDGVEHLARKARDEALRRLGYDGRAQAVHRLRRTLGYDDLVDARQRCRRRGGDLAAEGRNGSAETGSNHGTLLVRLEGGSQGSMAARSPPCRRKSEEHAAIEKKGINAGT